MSFTWRDFVGPVCVFVDGRWQNGKVVEIRTNHVVYKLSGDPDSFIISKDEAHSIIRKRGTVASVGKGERYTGSNPLIFGPKGCNIYGRKIVERKDRPGTYRVHFKYQTKKHHKVRHIKISLGSHVRSPVFLATFFTCQLTVLFACLQESEAAASLVCDGKIKEWLFNRNKFASQKRKRGGWIKKLNARKANDTPTANTPKR